MKRDGRPKKTLALLLTVLLPILLLAGCGPQPVASETVQQVELEPIVIEAVEEEAAEVAEEPEAVSEEPEIAEEPVVEEPVAELPEEAEPELPDPDGSYTSRDDVALYLYTYGTLPSNFMTKKEARALGWEGGSLEPFAPGMCIGGDYFGNYEERLPEGNYHECDIDTLGKKSRGAKRLIYSDDGRIYYTEDHYESFVLLYGEE